jgi:hypothetical protein
MKRRGLLALLALASLSPERAMAQRTWQLGYLSANPSPPNGKPPAGLVEALKQLGYEEDRNFRWVAVFADAKNERLPALAQ